MWMFRLQNFVSRIFDLKLEIGNETFWLKFTLCPHRFFFLKISNGKYENWRRLVAQEMRCVDKAQLKLRAQLPTGVHYSTDCATRRGACKASCTIGSMGCEASCIIGSMALKVTTRTSSPTNQDRRSSHRLSGAQVVWPRPHSPQAAKASSSAGALSWRLPLCPFSAALPG